MNGEYDVVVVGASGMVGEAMMSILEERKFPIRNIYPLEANVQRVPRCNSKVSPWKLDFCRNLIFRVFNTGCFRQVRASLMFMRPRQPSKDAQLFDNTSRFRNDPDVPLIIPEVNGEVLQDHNRLIANPNCSTIQMIVALKPIYDAVGIDRINVCTYQSVSGAGRAAVKELAAQSAALLSGRDVEVSVSPRQIAFNAIPHIDEFQGKWLHQRGNENSLGDP